jgi:hypothetical protein
VVADVAGDARGDAAPRVMRAAMRRRFSITARRSMIGTAHSSPMLSACSC